jgi:hypothetical protein
MGFNQQNGDFNGMYPLDSLTVCELEHGHRQFVDLPSYKMADFSSSLRKRLPEGNHYQQRIYFFVDCQRLTMKIPWLVMKGENILYRLMGMITHSRETRSQLV